MEMPFERPPDPPPVADLPADAEELTPEQAEAAQGGVTGSFSLTGTFSAKSPQGIIVEGPR